MLWMLSRVTNQKTMSKGFGKAHKDLVNAEESSAGEEQKMDGSPVRHGNGVAQLEGTQEGLPADIKNKKYWHELDVLDDLEKAGLGDYDWEIFHRNGYAVWRDAQFWA